VSRRTLSVAFLAFLAFLVAAAAGVLLARDDKGFRSTELVSLDQGEVLDPYAAPDELAKLSRLRVLYVDLSTTTSIRDAVAASTGDSAAALDGKLHAAAPTNSLVLMVQGDGANANEAQHRASALADALEAASDTRQQSVPEAQRVRWVTLREAGLGVDLSRSTRLTATTGLLSGASAAGMVVALAGMRRREEG
jgi:hypothetical protein